jgi:hypothetical protein
MRGCNYRSILIAITAVILCGCYPQFPDYPRTATAPANASMIGLDWVRDARISAEEGYDAVIPQGAMSEYIRGGAADRLRRAGFNVVMLRLAVPPSRQIPNGFEGRTVVITLNQVWTSVESPLFYPAVTDIELSVEVRRSSSREPLFRRHYVGTHRQRLDFSLMNASKARVVVISAAIDSALDRAFADESFLAALG